jgi:hypothetical protein
LVCLLFGLFVGWVVEWLVSGYVVSDAVMLYNDLCNFFLIYIYIYIYIYFIIRTKRVEELKFRSFIYWTFLRHFTLPTTLPLNGKYCKVTALLCCIRSSFAVFASITN